MLLRTSPKMLPSEPVHIAYQAKGKRHNKAVPAPNDALCARCGHNLQRYDYYVPVASVASNKFTEWDRLNGLDLCAACAWAYSELDNRLSRVVITPEGNLCSLESSQGSEAVLAARSDVCIVVPVSGKKHVLPYSSWGGICYDQGVISNSLGFASVVAATHYLRSVGVAEGAIVSKAYFLPSGSNLSAVLRAWETITSVDPGLLPLSLTMARLMDSRLLHAFFEGHTS